MELSKNQYKNQLLTGSVIYVFSFWQIRQTGGKTFLFRDLKEFDCQISLVFLVEENVHSLSLEPFDHPLLLRLIALNI
jgi:hypothetical protein